MTMDGIDGIDDTTMILNGSERSFSRALYVLDIFANISGLKATIRKLKPSG